jgi:hypothetical protein
LSSREGSYSQMAVAFSTTAIFVIRSITSTFPRSTTWARQLKDDQRDNIKKLDKHTVIVVHCCSIREDHGDYGYLQSFGKSCYYSRYCLMLQCRADMRIFDRIMIIR